MRVQEIMTRNVKSCSPETHLAATALLMWDQDCGVIPVIDHNKKVVGVITDRDISVAIATKNLKAEEATVGEVMSKKLFSCFPNDDLRDVLQIMRNQKIRRLPVVDEEGVLQGILSINDLLLQAKRNGSPSHEEIINALKSICEHRLAAAA